MSRKIPAPSKRRKRKTLKGIGSLPKSKIQIGNESDQLNRIKHSRFD